LLAVEGAGGDEQALNPVAIAGLASAGYRRAIESRAPP
jgi:hypothetical protein